MIVPNTALISTTITEAISVSLIAAHASGLEISFQNACVPPSNAFEASAAIGSSTRMLR